MFDEMSHWLLINLQFKCGVMAVLLSLRICCDRMKCSIMILMAKYS